ncbi:MAG: hypothetical protein R2776_05420 [Flavobacteriaceae bacterium]|nr:hypothetical protein [Flavobacteriaceae bacterium]
MNFRKGVYLILCVGICSSCQFFNTERISSETFYQEEFDSIDWNQVDTYPSFKECETKTEKESQKACFQEVIVTSIQLKLSGEKMVANHEIHDTVHLLLQIEKSSEIGIQEIVMDSLLLQKIPNLKGLFTESIEQLHLSAPAYKRGIPVTTQIKLPFVVNSEEL